MVMSTTIGKGDDFTFSPPRALFRFGCFNSVAQFKTTFTCVAFCLCLWLLYVNNLLSIAHHTVVVSASFYVGAETASALVFLV